MGMLYPIEGRPANPLGKFYRVDHRCAYHSGAVGHDTDNCSTLKHKIQNMINNDLINIEETTWMDDKLDTQKWVQDISEWSCLKIFIIKGREKECPTLAKFCIWSFVTFPLKMYRTFLTNYVWPEFLRTRYVGGLCWLRSPHLPPLIISLYLNYVRPEFSRMRYVGGLCRPRSVSL